MKQKALISEECWFVRNFLEPRRKVEIYYVAANLFFRVTKSEMVEMKKYLKTQAIGLSS